MAAMTHTLELDAECRNLLDAFEGVYGAPKGRRLFVVAPGRTEIAGNHTDHEGGDVIAGAVDRHAAGIFVPNGGHEVRLFSRGYDPVTVDLGSLDARPDEKGTTVALVRGMAALFSRRGLGSTSTGGFDAYMDSGVPAGSGLSSSAAFELELAQAFNHLWAGGALEAETLALMGQADEHEFFGKPCGLMDQAASALGGIQHMSFRDPQKLVAEPLDFDFAEHGYAICLVSVGADHSALIDDYAAIPREMQAVASMLGGSRLCEVDKADYYAELPILRNELGDRAVLRALHYWGEQAMVFHRVEALRKGDIDNFLLYENSSGVSSVAFLQNVSVGGSREQPAMVALGLAAAVLGGKGAYRIHGGGFGGTIQAFVPLGMVGDFSATLDGVFGEGACGVYNIDHEGARAKWL